MHVICFFFRQSSETQGIVLLEAMASKLPVVAVKASGVMDVVENGVNGYMTTGNEEDWANRIWDIIMNNNLRLKLKDGAFRNQINTLTLKLLNWPYIITKR